MQLTSISFFIFLFIVTAIYYSLAQKYRNYLLLVASYYFYFSIQPEYLVLLIGSTLVNYWFGIGIERQAKQKKVLLNLNLVFNVGMLFFFKYFNFFGDQVNAAFSMFSLNLSVPHHSYILPIGISFYTFMAIGYILDVYWGDIKAQKNLLIFSVYMSFFPQILCGPIGRAKSQFKQIATEHALVYDNFSNGFRLILWGLFKKMVVADNLGAYVDAVFNNIPMHSTLTLLFATLLFPIQLYADFSGYTEIARGVGKLLGFDLMVNFKTPYINSVSVTDYWRRNHISLTSWFRDYIYYPFMGNSMSKIRMYAGILIMFLVSGLWHGASWMFLIWGLLQAVFLIVEDKMGASKTLKTNTLMAVVRKVFTYLVISLGLIFFRLRDLGDLSSYLQVLNSNSSSFYTGSSSTIAFIFVGLVSILVIELIINKVQFDEWIGGITVFSRWSIYVFLSIVIILIGVLDGQAFIYFQF